MTAEEIIKDLLESYKPEWHYEMGRLGYQCNFCKSVIRHNLEFYNPEEHTSSCPLMKAWFEEIKK